MAVHEEHTSDKMTILKRFCTCNSIFFSAL